MSICVIYQASFNLLLVKRNLLVQLSLMLLQLSDLFPQRLAVLVVSLLPLVTLVPVFLKVTLPDGVRSVWAIVNIMSALVGLLPSIICVKSEESRSVVNIVSTIISVLLMLMVPGIIALALVMNFLQ